MARSDPGERRVSGHPLLRREIAALYAGLEPEDVLVFAGAEEDLFVNVLLGPGDHAVVTWPGYQSLYEVARATGADVTSTSCAKRPGGRSTLTPCAGRSRPRPGSSS